MGCACKQKREEAQKRAQEMQAAAVAAEQGKLSTAVDVSNPSKGADAISADAYKTDIALEPVAVVEERPNAQQPPKNVHNTTTNGKQAGDLPKVVKEALENNLEQCYLCAKKHLARAQIFFEEYHTGYPDHIKNLVQSLKAAEIQVRGAFLRWQKIMGHLDMAANELLGNDINSEAMNKEHLILANQIRAARIKISDDPLASIDFDTLLLKVHLLQYKELDK